jgi:sugar phosphate isomerase/epimerase
LEICLFSSALIGWDAARVASAAADAGLAAVEWGIGPGQAVESPGKAAALDALGVDAAGICVQGGAASLIAPARLGPFAALAARLGAPHVRVFAPGFRERRHARKGLAAAAEIADEHGVTLLVETAPDTIAPSTAQARALVDGFPPERIGVLYDPGNMVIEGHLDPRLAIEELGPYLRHVHVKNVSWLRERGAWRWRHAPLAEGMLDWAAIVGELARTRYAGRLSLDHLGGRASVAVLLREVNVLRALLSP